MIETASSLFAISWTNFECLFPVVASSSETLHIYKTGLLVSNCKFLNLGFSDSDIFNSLAGFPLLSKS
jgi:hypothetical protein